MALSEGDKLICVNAHGVKGLTEGKSYEFQKDHNGLIRVKAANHGRSEAYKPYRLEKARN